MGGLTQKLSRMLTQSWSKLNLTLLSVQSLPIFFFCIMSLFNNRSTSSSIQQEGILHEHNTRQLLLSICFSGYSSILRGTCLSVSSPVNPSSATGQCGLWWPPRWSSISYWGSLITSRLCYQELTRDWIMWAPQCKT